MSAYLVLETPILDRECLLLALADLGFGADKVEVHDEPVPLVGYEGRTRPEVAHLVVRRQHLGGSSNDLGFLRGPTGWRAIVSGYDALRFGQTFQQALAARHAVHLAAKEARIAEEDRRRADEERRRVVEAQRQAIHDRAKKLGYRVQETREGATIRLVLVRRTW